MEEEFYSIEEANRWSSVFQRLHHIARTKAGSQSDGKKQINATRNRYRDVIPINDFRVKLNDDENDYINASFIEVEDVQRKYILCQGPLQHTCHHFWQMVWEQKSMGIVMLNKCIEQGREKCFQYWPTSLDEPVMEMASYRVELISIEDTLLFRMSTLQLKNLESEEESRTVLHFHYTRWPDFGVPRNPDDFLEFLYAVRKAGVLDPNVGPSVVHCSAGIGRSGTFCLVDVCLQKIELASDLSIELQPILLDMRRQRLGLVQTAEQLRFCYIAVLQASIPDSDSEEIQGGSDSDEEIGIPNGHDMPETTTSAHFHDVPPPIPPRYPDMVPTPSPPPPPPPTLPPPGPPIYNGAEDTSEDEETRQEIVVKYISNDSTEDDDIPWYTNEGDPPPPVPPPRVESANKGSPFPDHFLAVGRGEENEAPPLPPPTQSVPVPQPLQEQKQEEGRPRLKSFNEEEALINELNELEKMISPPQTIATVTTNDQETRVEEPPQDNDDDESLQKAKELRKKEREERQRRLNEKVALMKAKIDKEERKEWSSSWVVMGAVVVASYCVYYYFS